MHDSPTCMLKPELKSERSSLGKFRAGHIYKMRLNLIINATFTSIIIQNNCDFEFVTY